MKFALVTYTDEDGAHGIVSTNWIDFENEICWFPKVISEEKKTKLLLAREQPTENWMQCKITISKIFNNYYAAREALNKAEANSETDSERSSRKRKKKYIFLPDDSICDEDEPRSAKQSSNFVIKSYSSLSELPELPSLRLSQTSIPEITQQQLHVPVLSIKERNASAIDDAISGINENIKQIQTKQDLMWDNINNLSSVFNRIENKIDAVLESIERKPLLTMDSKDFVNLASFPIRTEEEFQKFNTLLIQNYPFRQSLLASLPVAGGKNLKALISNILRKLILDDVGETYSLTGKPARHHHVKNAFEKTEVYKLIVEICYNSFHDAKEPAVREAISDWLMQAKFRKSRKESRMLQSSSQGSAPTTSMS